MSLIPLTHGLNAQVDDVDITRLKKWRWFAKWKAKRRRWVVGRNVGKSGFLPLSRAILSCPEGMMVDHKNGDPFDNRRENLRLATNQQNQHNQRNLRLDNSSGYKGVTWFKPRGCWCAQIYHHKKHINLGYFRNKKEAALAYNEAAVRLFGEFAAPNEIRED